jgi:hypothetical protein
VVRSRHRHFPCFESSVEPLSLGLMGVVEFGARPTLERLNRLAVWRVGPDLPLSVLSLTERRVGSSWVGC